LLCPFNDRNNSLLSSFNIHNVSNYPDLVIFEFKSTS